MNFKKTILGFMALLLVAIWVRNLFLFLPSTKHDDATGMIERSKRSAAVSKATIGDTTFVLDRNLRDPFALPKKAVVERFSEPKALPVTRPVESIRASLMGHVYESSSPFVIAFDSVTKSTNTYGLRDSLNGFVLTAISKQEITWKSLKGRNVVWEIEQ